MPSLESDEGGGRRGACLRNGWDGRIRTYECQSQSLVPYHLATSQDCPGRQVKPVQLLVAPSPACGTGEGVFCMG